MPNLLSLFADAYQGGQFAGQSIRWVVLIGLGVVLVRRLVRGSFGPGFRRSPAGTVLSLVVVAAGLIASVTHDFRGDDMRPARASIVSGCTSGGAEASVCGCYADQLLERTDHDIAKLDALTRQMADARTAGRPMPATVLASVDACMKSEAPTS
jgi:hypothetical protein